MTAMPAGDRKTGSEQGTRNRRARALLFAAMRRDGYPYATIAALQGISRQRVLQIMQTACPPLDPKRNPDLTPEQQQQALTTLRPAWSYPDKHTLAIIQMIKAEMREKPLPPKP